MDAKKEFWEGLKELKEAMKETDRRMKETDKRLGELTDSWGRFVEGIVSPSAAETFRRAGYKILSAHHRVEIMDGKQGVQPRGVRPRVVVEFDTLLEGKKDGNKFLFIGEAKTFCKSNDIIEEFIEELGRVKKYLPDYRDCKIIGFIAAMNFGDGVDKFAARNGLYVLKPSGDTMVLDVPKGFKPKIW